MNTYLACLWKTKAHPPLRQEIFLPYLLRKPSRSDTWHSPSGLVEIHAFEYWPELVLPGKCLLKKENAALCFDGFPDTGSGTDLASPEEYERALFDVAVQDLHRLQGEFSLAYANDNAISVFINRNGSHALYYTDHHDYIAFSNRLPLLLQLPGACPELDPEAAQWLCYQGFTQCGVTAFKAIRKLPPGARAVATAEGRLDIRPTTYSDLRALTPQDISLGNLQEVFDEHCAALSGYMKRMHRFYSGHGMTLRLSGGKDSRVVLGLLLHAGLKEAIDNVYTTGPLYSPDVISAQDLIEKTGLKDRYRIVRETVIYEELRLDMGIIIESLNVTAGQLSVHDFAPIPAHTSKILVTGHQGVRDAWFRHCPTTSVKDFGDAMFTKYFHDPLHLLGKSIRSAFMEKYLGMFQDFVEREHAPLDSVAELHALREVQGTWAAAINMATHLSAPMSSPLLHPLVCSLTFALPKDLRSHEAYHFMALYTMARDLLSIPFANQQWSPELRKAFEGAFEVPATPPYRSSMHFPAYSNPFLPPVKMAYYNSLKPFMARLAQKHADWLEPALSLKDIEAAMRIKATTSPPEMVCGMGLYTTLLLAEYGPGIFHQETSRSIAAELNDSVQEKVIRGVPLIPETRHDTGQGIWNALDSTLEFQHSAPAASSPNDIVRCNTSSHLWAGMCWGWDGNRTAAVQCEPSTSYSVSVLVQGIDVRGDTRLHLVVYDQTGTQLCAPAFTASSSFEKVSTEFTTTGRSTHLCVHIVKAKSPEPVSFLAKDLVVMPLGRSSINLYRDAIERCEKAIAGLVRELQSPQTNQKTKSHPPLRPLYRIVRRNRLLYYPSKLILRLTGLENVLKRYS